MPRAEPALSFDEVYRAHAPGLLRLLSNGFGYRGAGGRARWARLDSGFDVEDVAQEAFVLLMRAAERGSFDTSREVRPYLYRIAVNLALKRIGKGSREVPFEKLEVIESMASPVEDDMHRRECGELLRAFKDTLSEREQAVLAGYFAEEDASQSAAAKKLGLSRDQVARSVASIRKKSMSFFKERGWFNES